MLEGLQAIKPRLDGQDKVWSLWICSDRGPVSAFADDEEYEEMKDAGEIQDMQDLKSLRNDYYPEKVNWHEVTFRIYGDILFFGFDSRLIFQLDLETKQAAGNYYGGKEILEFLLWVQSRLKTGIAEAV